MATALRSDGDDQIGVENIPECQFCGSIDGWETPAGAFVCRFCRTVTSKPDPFKPDWLAGNTIGYQERTQIFSKPIERRCVCCGGRSTHGPHCGELLKNWNRMPWGKYKDRPLSLVPSGYFLFVLEKGYGSRETKDMMIGELEVRGVTIPDSVWLAMAKSDI